MLRKRQKYHYESNLKSRNEGAARIIRCESKFGKSIDGTLKSQINYQEFINEAKYDRKPNQNWYYATRNHTLRSHQATKVEVRI